MRDVFAGRMLELARVDERIMFLTGDLGFGVFEDFAQACPQQYLNVGVAEQNMIAVATGLALEGRVVFAYSIGNFPVLRCLEQIRNDAAYHEASVKVVSIGGGFSYGPLGMSHHATEDIAILRSIPGIEGYTPGTRQDVTRSVDALVARPGTGYLRLDKSAGEETTAAEEFRHGHWRVMSDGADVALIACGGILAEAQLAAKELSALGLSARVVNAVQFGSVSNEAILEAIGDVPLVVTIEEHVERGGLTGMVAEAVVRQGRPIRVVSRAIAGGFVSQVGSQHFLRERLGLDWQSIVRTVQAATDDSALVQQ